MPRPSKIDRLPVEFRDAIGRLREDGHTLDEILIHLHKMGLDEDGMPSRSGLHRHVQGLDELAELLNSTKSASEILVRRFEDDPEGRRARLNAELMQAVMTTVVAASVSAEGVKLTPQQVAFLAKALKDIAMAQATDLNTKIKLRAEMRTEMEAKLKEVEQEAEASGVPITPAEMLARIRALYNGEG